MAGARGRCLGRSYRRARKIMTDSSDPKRKYLNELEKVNDSGLYPEDVRAIQDFAAALDKEDPTVTFIDERGERKTAAYNTIATHIRNLRLFASKFSMPLMEATPDEINRTAKDLHRGNHPNTPTDGYSRGSVKLMQTALRMFYRFHDDVLNYEEITRFTTGPSPVDERDMFTREEVQAMRREASHPRDRALLELLLNTGQRIRAIQTLRIKDIDIENSVYYLNDEAGGLKGADKRGLKRPLLGAKPAVAEWLQHHPARNDRDAYLLTSKINREGHDPGQMMAYTTLRKHIKRIAERAGVDKPANPHNFRHYFVTVAKRNYKMDDSTVKFLIGHKEGSNVMETTYTHLTSDDHIEDAEVATGHRDPDKDSPLTPEVCPTCSAILEENDKACAACGEVFTPDAQAAKDKIAEVAMRAMREAGDDVEADAVEDVWRWLSLHPDIPVQMDDDPERVLEILRERFGDWTDDEDSDPAASAMSD